jgi:lysophospholipase L1-like esterase
MLCTDRFHPSINGYRRWGSQLAESALALLSAS